MDEDDLFAQQWQLEQHATPDATVDTPHDYWLIPPGANNEVEKEIQQIHNNTGAYLQFNRTENRIDMWGNRAEIGRARDRLDVIARAFFEERIQKRRGPERGKFAKAERPRTPKEQRKAEQETLRLMNQFKYGQPPRDECEHSCSIVIPPEVTPARLARLFGQSLQSLDDLRTDLKVHAWLDSRNKVIEVAGNNPENVGKMQARVKNVLIRNLRGISIVDTHILDKPSSMKAISFIPTTPLPIFIEDPQVDTRAYITGESLQSGPNMGLAFQNLTVTDSLSSSSTSSNHWIERLARNSIEEVSTFLRKKLTELWLESTEVRMKIRFGVAAFSSYPLAPNIDMEFFAENHISRLKSRFISQFQSSSPNFINRLIDVLRGNLGGNVISYDPVAVWALDYNSPESRLYATFRSDGYPSLWNAAMRKTTVMDLKVLSVDKSCDWSWTITTAHRLKDLTPFKEFMEKIRLDYSEDEPVLKFRNTSSVRVLGVIRKTIWCLLWGNWMIELREIGRWTEGFSHHTSSGKVLSPVPEQVTYSVSMYHDSWKSRFSLNPVLNIGERASWNPDDFINNELESESVEETMAAARHVQQILDSALLQEL